MDRLLTADNLTALGLLFLVIGAIVWSLLTGRFHSDHEVKALTKLWEERIAIAEKQRDELAQALEVALDTNRLLTGVKAEATYQHARTTAALIEAAQNRAEGVGEHEHPAS